VLRQVGGESWGRLPSQAANGWERKTGGLVETVGLEVQQTTSRRRLQEGEDGQWH